MSNVTIYSVPWALNGYDCRPISIMVAEHIFKNRMTVKDND